MVNGKAFDVVISSKKPHKEVSASFIKNFSF